jgi:hypothetical protein
MHARRTMAAAIAAGALLVAACSDDGSEPSGPDQADRADRADQDGPPGTGGLVVTALSTDASRVTGGDVLVRVAGTEDLPEATVDGAPVEVDFTAADGSLTGLVTGLPEGDAVIEVTAGEDTGRLEVTNHPITGPVFSGPHLEPFACTTEANGLGPPTDDDCSAATEVRWSYVTTDDAVVPLEDPASIPDDAATTELDGQEVPLVVRTESGTINRGVYWVHVLDPSPGDEGTWDDVAWSGTLVYRFGGGCGSSYSQGSVLGDAGTVAGAGFDVDLLRAGHAMATNTFNTFQVVCNDVLSAESLMMTKEHFVESYGIPDHTVGEGGSGGAIQQYLIAQNHPGLLDAIVAAVPFPDALSIAPGVVDCGLLEDFYASDQGAGWTPEQRAAVNGHAVAGTCSGWTSSFLGNIDPTTGCALDAGLVYDPDANPDGARCSLADSNVNTMGRDAETGFANRPVDNIGVQYGLAALLDGVISVEDFLDLNESIGGYDIDGVIVGDRMEADEDALRIIYEGGRINQGAGDLRQIPILTLDLYTDPIADIHDRVRSFALLERLRLDDGERSPNAVLWTLPGGDDLIGALLGTSGRSTRVEMIALAVEWLDGLDSPAGERTPEELLTARPDGAGDLCVTPDGERHTGDDLHDDGHPCAEAYPVAGEPRIAAGAPLDSVVGKCQLAPVDPDAYGTALIADQAQRLEAIFPDGVCDWDQPGLGQVEPLGPWLDYSEGPPR